MNPRIQKLIDDYTALMSTHPGPVPYSLSHKKGDSDFHLLIFCATHGNEVGSLEPSLNAFKNFASKDSDFKGRLTLVWGNPDASKKGLRFVEEDLNRAYLKFNPDTLEGRRAKALAPIIESADLFIDFHQTIEPTLCPFYIFRISESSLQLAQALGGVTELITKDPLPVGGPETLTQNEYATIKNIPSVTIELGPKGFNKSSEQLCEKLIARALEIAHLLSEKSATLSQLADDKPPLSIFKIVHGEPFKDRKLKLRPGLKNLQPIRKGEMIGTDSEDNPLNSPQDGVILFPKYPSEDEPLPSFIYVLAEVVTDKNSLFDV